MRDTVKCVRKDTVKREIYSEVCVQEYTAKREIYGEECV